MRDAAGIAAALAEVREAVADAALRAGRRADEVAIMAVTKFHGREAVDAAYEAGLRLFGESRVQEAEGKYRGQREDLPGARLEMIGHLQGNKAKKAVELFDCIQSVDRLDLLMDLHARSRALGKRLDILFELHTGEESKAGLPDEEALFRACDRLAELEATSGAGGLRLRGLMTMAPFTEEEARIRGSFRRLRKAFEAVQNRYPGSDLDTLSMGMSGDFTLAVEEGSTLVRIGTRFFGERA